MESNIKVAINHQWINKALIDKKGNQQYADVYTSQYGDAVNAEGDPPRRSPFGFTDARGWHKINMAHDWQNVELDLDTLFALLTDIGGSVCPWVKDGHRNDNNFVCADLVMVDIDNGLSVEQAVENTMFKDFASFLYTSQSHGQHVSDRFRIGFIMERTITSPDDMRAIQNALIQIFGGDESCKDAARLFYGYNHALGWTVPDKIIPNDVLDILIKAGTPPPIVVPEPVDFGDVSDLERLYILQKLQNTFLGDYGKWLVVAAGLKQGGYTCAEFTQATIGGMMHEKSKSDCTRLWSGLNGTRGVQATMGSIWHIIGGRKGFHEFKKIINK